MVPCCASATLSMLLPALASEQGPGTSSHTRPLLLPDLCPTACRLAKRCLVNGAPRALQGANRVEDLSRLSRRITEFIPLDVMTTLTANLADYSRGRPCINIAASPAFARASQARAAP